MVTQTKCVLTTVGPYQLYGQNIIKQCAQHGTDYVDLCGEPGWMHEMINEYSKQAEETGARIVFHVVLTAFLLTWVSFFCKKKS